MCGSAGYKFPSMLVPFSQIRNHIGLLKLKHILNLEELNNSERKFHIKVENSTVRALMVLVTYGTKYDITRRYFQL